MAGQLHGGRLRLKVARESPVNDETVIRFAPFEQGSLLTSSIRFQVARSPAMARRKGTLKAFAQDREGAARLFDLVTANAQVRAYEPIFKTKLEAHVHDRDLIEKLGKCMAQIGGDTVLSNTGAIPAAYTYIGQFIAHDITQMKIVNDHSQENLVTAALDLSSLFDPPIGRMVGPTVPSGNLQDLPRFADGRADIPDPRNDFTLAVSQIHVMLARFHLHICGARDKADPDAMQTTRNCFQYAVLHDYLPKIVGDVMATDVLSRRLVIAPALSPDLFFVPLEFAMAFFRFGHCMVRGKYVGWIGSTTSVSTSDLWRTANQGDLLPVRDSWTMPWASMFADVGSTTLVNHARGLGARLTSTLAKVPVALIDQPQAVYKDMGNDVVNLAVETMLRGNSLGLATAQQLGGQLESVIEADGGALIDFSKPAELQAALRGADATLLAFLNGEGQPFLQHTPLWLYTLLEAQRYADGRHLGPMAGRVVAETIYAAIAADPDGILGASKGFHPSDVALNPTRPNGWFEAMTRRAMSPLPNRIGV